jgi:hypothetical protein
MMLAKAWMRGTINRLIALNCSNPRLQEGYGHHARPTTHRTDRIANQDREAYIGTIVSDSLGIVTLDLT